MRKPRAFSGVVVVDIGVNYDFADTKGLVHKKVVSGTRNMLEGPAMTRQEAEQCIEVGIELVRDRDSKEPATQEMLQVMEICKQHGLLIGKGGIDGNVIRIQPSLELSVITLYSPVFEPPSALLPSPPHRK